MFESPRISRFCRTTSLHRHHRSNEQGSWDAVTHSVFYEQLPKKPHLLYYARTLEIHGSLASARLLTFISMHTTNGQPRFSQNLQITMLSESYWRVRAFSLNDQKLPPAISIEELYNFYT